MTSANRLLGPSVLVVVLAACGQASTPVTPSRPGQLPPSDMEVAGTWQGVIDVNPLGYYDYFSASASFWLSLTQTRTSATGTFACPHGCFHEIGDITATVSGNQMTGRVEFPDGHSCDTFDGMLSGSKFSGRYVCSGHSEMGTGTWSLTKTRSTPMPPASALCVPQLVAPVEGAVLDNGRADFDRSTDAVIWEFDWSDCPGAIEYDIFVMGPGAIYPLVLNRSGNPITESSFRSVSCGSYIIDANRRGWRWRVRALTDGVWGQWSAERTFDVEPLFTDPPLGCGS